jgi:hypothetical protein
VLAARRIREATPHHERIHAFWKAVAARASVQAIANPTEFYLDRYRARGAAPAATNGRESTR